MRKRLEQNEAQDQAMARGMDTQAMIPVLAALFEAISMLFLPWVSVPALKYSPYPHTCPLMDLPDFSNGVAWQYDVPETVTRAAQQSASWLRTAALILAGFSLLFIILAYKKKIKALFLGRAVFLANGLLPLGAGIWITDTNMMLDLLEGNKNSFLNLTLYSHVQLTAWAYAQTAAALFLIPALRTLLDTRKEYRAEYYAIRRGGEHKKITKRLTLTFVLVLTAIPAVIFFGIFFLNDRNNYFVSLCIIILSMLPFFAVFEDRRPQAREVVVISVMAGLGTAGRVAFFMLPHFKPAAAVVIISGVCLGGEAGFLTGALVGFASNFFFGQGPWAPWQMFAYGIIGFLAGLIFRDKRNRWKHFRLWLCIYGGAAVLLVYGVLLDLASLFSSMAKLSVSAFLALLATGLPLNLIHATATVLFLAFLEEPLIKKLERVKIKYGILDP